MSQFYTISLFLLLLVFIYFTYQIMTLLVTMLKQRKKEGAMEFCLSSTGKYAYIGMIVGYVVAWAIFIWTCIVGWQLDSLQWINNGLSVLTIYTLIFSMQLANIILLGKKHMLIGRLLVDYRKMKKVDLNSKREMTFVYAQKTFRFSTRFIDIKKLRATIARKGQY